MKRTLKLFILFCFTAIIMCGCNQTDTPKQPLSHVVTKVDVLYRRNNMLLQRHYTDNKKMQSVLLYLRLLEPKKLPDSQPEITGSDICQITVRLSDGQKRVYRQTRHRFFSNDYRPWETIDPGKAYDLYVLLQKLPSDPVFAGNPP